MPPAQFIREWRRGRAVAARARHDTTPPPPRAFARFGSGSVLVPPTRVTLPEVVSIGDGVVILEGCWLSVVHAHPEIVPRLTIGDGTRLGRGLSIACIGEVTVGPEVMASDDVFIADCYHDYRDPHTPILYQPMSMPEPVEIGAGAFLGAESIILPGVRIGAGAYVGEGAVVTRDVPAGAVVFGNPARVVSVAAG